MNDVRVVNIDRIQNKVTVTRIRQNSRHWQEYFNVSPHRMKQLEDIRYNYDKVYISGHSYGEWLLIEQRPAYSLWTFVRYTDAS